MKSKAVSVLGRWAGIISASALPALSQAQSPAPAAILPPPTAPSPVAAAPAGLAVIASTPPSTAPVPQAPGALAQNNFSDPTVLPLVATVGPTPNGRDFDWQQGGGDAMNPFGQSAKPASPVVVNFGQINSERQGQIGEDLEVMSLLMQKKLEQSFGSMPTIHLGIPMLVRHGSPPVQSMFVEGYGAIFMIRVNFPLAGAPEPQKTKTEDPKDSEWESIRNQLHGDPGPVNSYQYVPNGFQIGQAHPGFSQERVEAVEDQLIHSLRYASNIRGLSPQDFVVISVSGTGASHHGVRSTTTYSGFGGGGGGGGQPGLGSMGGTGSGGGGFGGTISTVEVAGEGKTFLSLRAKVSDIKAFAAGELKFEDFKAQVAKHIYRSGANPATEAAGR